LQHTSTGASEEEEQLLQHEEELDEESKQHGRLFPFRAKATPSSEIKAPINIL